MKYQRARVSNGTGSIIAGGVFLASLLGAPGVVGGFDGIGAWVAAGIAATAFLLWSAVTDPPVIGLEGSVGREGPSADRTDRSGCLPVRSALLSRLRSLTPPWSRVASFPSPGQMSMPSERAAARGNAKRMSHAVGLWVTGGTARKGDRSAVPLLHGEITCF